MYSHGLRTGTYPGPIGREIERNYDQYGIMQSQKSHVLRQQVL